MSLPNGGVRMTAALAYQIGGRVSAWAKQAYPRDTAKVLAREFDASIHTTRRWVEGEPPSNAHLAMMARRWGKSFVQFCFEPLTGPWSEIDALDEAFRNLRQKLDALEDSMARGEVSDIADASLRAEQISVSAGRAAIFPRAVGGHEASKGVARHVKTGGRP